MILVVGAQADVVYERFAAVQVVFVGSTGVGGRE